MNSIFWTSFSFVLKHRAWISYYTAFQYQNSFLHCDVKHGRMKERDCRASSSSCVCNRELSSPVSCPENKMPSVSWQSTSTMPLSHPVSPCPGLRLIKINRQMGCCCIATSICISMSRHNIILRLPRRVTCTILSPAQHPSLRKPKMTD